VHHLSQNLPGATASGAAKGLSTSASSLRNLPPNILDKVLHAFAGSFHDVFLVGVPFALAAFVVALFLRESPLHESAKGDAEGEGLEAGHVA
jgi:hypothetical protein